MFDDPPRLLPAPAGAGPEPLAPPLKMKRRKEIN
jgi:hypothetical protein